MKKYIADLNSSRYIVEWSEDEITVAAVDNRIFIKGTDGSVIGKDNRMKGEIRKFYFSKNDEPKKYYCVREDWDYNVVRNGQLSTIELARLFCINISHNGDHISIEDEFISGSKSKKIDKSKIDIYFDAAKNLCLENMRG